MFAFIGTVYAGLMSAVYRSSPFYKTGEKCKCCRKYSIDVCLCPRLREPIRVVFLQFLQDSEVNAQNHY